ncbi:anthranilate synthase component I [Virgibacillus profundi]|uniref:Anthranilate synthase component 1 n=1 Tax=Virgibacillus profundi TaxID=2024555 RepID=A0A2A2IFW2_9BACI|nr:anthranilate synthase component I [Virgibacillus profundi]PAV30547.1 anthranilate synthase component I [Virgibacillus profundi]PXY54719.1 anthranilate synthase component I [Virgibacillus profundi]
MKDTQTASFKLIKLNADTLTPIGIFQSLSGKKKFLLESTFQHEEKGKFSFIGSEPYQEIIGRGNKTTVNDLENEHVNYHNQNALDYMKCHLPKIEIDLPLPFYGGAVGYIGYDFIRQYEDIGPSLTDDLNMPDIHFMVYKDVIIFDHSNETVYAVAMNPGLEPEALLDKRLESLRNTLTTKADVSEGDLSSIDFEPELTEQQFIEKVRIAQEKIHQGEVLQVVLSQKMKAKMNGDPFSFYRRLRRANPSPYMFYINFEDYLVLGASPESLIQTTGRDVVTNPIAGTRARGKTPHEDEVLIKDLLSDEKELSEHRMLVDLSKNDLGKVCESDSITIPTYMKIEKYQHVMHIVSEVKGRLNKNLSGLDALIACLPAGTVSGEPKVRAMQIINELEEKKRGVYAGGIGFINFNHDLNIALAIRSLVIKGTRAYLQAGAGIVYDSVPEKEYLETLQKAKSLMEVYQADPVN